MGKRHDKGLTLVGRMPQAGVTFYERKGKIVVRPSQNGSTPHRCTLKQFIQRQRMRHSIALWHELSQCDTMFTEHQSAYSGFVALANKLPAVFVDKNMADHQASFLMPDIPVSEGKLLTVKQHLGEVDGVAAFITNLKQKDIRPRVELRLYTAEQRVGYSTPTVSFEDRKVKKSELVETEEGLALLGDEFADNNKGWALVLIDGKRCSTQGIITRCTLYEQYTTQEALFAAVKSHSNRKMKIELPPDNVIVVENDSNGE